MSELPLCLALELCGRSGDIIIPRRERKDEWYEYCDGRSPEECASKEYFNEVVRKAPEIKHIKHARECLNFQHCKVCVRLNAKVASVIATGDPGKIALAKLERQRHHTETRMERLAYYKKREAAMSHPDDCAAATG